MNVGPVISKLQYIADMIDHLGLDVLIVPETHLTDTGTFRANLGARGLQAIMLARPAPAMSYRSRVGGALAVVWRKNGPFDLSVLSNNQKGAVSIMCRSRDGRSKCAIIASYVPPTSSTYARWRAPLFQWMRDEYERLSALFADVIIAGDLNSRWGTMAPDGEKRATADARSRPAADAAFRPFRGSCLGEGICPTHGRPGGEPGFTTSGAPAVKAGASVGRAEADYILTGPDTTVEPRAPISWDEVAAHGRMVHRPVVCRVRLPVAPNAAQPPASRPAAAQPADAAEPVAPARYHIPHYNSSMWKRVGETMCGALAGAEQVTRVAASTFQEAVGAVYGVLASGAELLRNPDVSIRSAAYRRFAGSSAPPQAARLFEIARGLRKEGRALRKKSRGGGGMAPAAADAAGDPAAAIFRKAARLQKRACRLARDSIRARAIARDTDLRNLRPRDAHGWFTTLNHAVAGDNPLLQESASRIPDRDGVPAATTFTNFFRNLFQGKPAPPATAPGATAPDGTLWTDFIPTASKPDADATPLDAPFDWTWVYLSLFPPPSPARNDEFPFPKCRPGCQRCTDFVNSRAHGAPPGTNPLDWRPRINTSTSAGSDGLRAELIRWTQCGSTEETWTYRCRMARAITDTLNKALRDGMYTGLAKAVLVALYKGKGDRADPSLYRGIAMQNLVPKILSTLLSARLSHWAQWHGLIWPEQIGFKHQCGSEYHVMALLETLKARARDDVATAVLFVDFYKAYDCVHPEAVWLTLEKMGVPPGLVGLLRSWGQMRRVAVRVNGVLSEPFSVETGVAQGDPLSPLLFNLFIQSLSGWLGSRPDLHGARVNPSAAMGSVAAETVVKRLLYADDLAAVDTMPAGLQRALNYVKVWADAWGMRVNCSEGKTEAIWFAPGSVPKPAPLSCGGETVKFVDSYVYLGHTLWYDMRGGAKDHIGPVVANFAKRFTYCTAMRRAAVSSQLQMFKTCVQGAANYLRGIALLTDAEADGIDVYTRRAGRLMLGLPKCGNELVWALSGLLTARGTNAREMHRIDLQLRHTAHTDLDVVKVVAATALRRPQPARQAGAAFKPDRFTCWTHAHDMVTERERALGAVLLEPTSYADIADAAFVFGRSVSFNEAQREVRNAMPLGGDTASLPPRSNGSSKHAGWLLCYMPFSAADLGSSRHTPLSVLGPGCSGSLHTLADHSLARAPANAALGNEALHCYPFLEEVRVRKPKKGRRAKRAKRAKRDGSAAPGAAPPPKSKRAEHAKRGAAAAPAAQAEAEAEHHGNDSDPEGDAPPEPPARPRNDYAKRYEHAPCRLCHAADSSSIYHLITACPHAAMVAARADLRRSLPVIISAIVRDCAAATFGASRVAATKASQAESAALALITASDGVLPDNDDGRMLAYRILVGTPWPRDPMARAGGTFPAAAALGAVFDATTAPPARLRGMAARWLAWSDSQLCSIARRWRLAQGLVPLKPRSWSLGREWR